MLKQPAPSTQRRSRAEQVAHLVRAQVQQLRQARGADLCVVLGDHLWRQRARSAHGKVTGQQGLGHRQHALDRKDQLQTLSEHTRAQACSTCIRTQRMHLQMGCSSDARPRPMPINSQYMSMLAWPWHMLTCMRNAHSQSCPPAGCARSRAASGRQRAWPRPRRQTRRAAP
jgi:hypothetical protein